MFQTLRNNTWIIKFIVGFIALVMIVFFGSETIRKGNTGAGQGQMHSSAKVNGVKINQQRVNFLVNQQLEPYRQILKDALTEDMIKNVRSNVVNSLINRELLWQESSRLGMNATPTEIADFVREQPQFQENGEFRQELFDEPEGYRAAFLQRNGISYISEITTQLTLEKLFQQLDDALTPSPTELRWLQKTKDTSFEFSVVRIDKHPEAKTGAEDPKITAALVYDLLKSGGKTEAALKERGLQLKDTGPLSYSKLKIALDGEDNRDNLKKLASLTPQKPMPDTFLETENFYYVVKLKNLKSEVQDTKDNTADNDLKEIYNNHLTTKLQEAMVRELRKSAKIEANF